jgi:hypothetical protein
LEDAHDGLQNLLTLFESRGDAFPETLGVLREMVTDEGDPSFGSN